MHIRWGSRNTLLFKGRGKISVEVTVQIGEGKVKWTKSAQKIQAYFLIPIFASSYPSKLNSTATHCWLQGNSPCQGNQFHSLGMVTKLGIALPFFPTLPLFSTTRPLTCLEYVNFQNAVISLISPSRQLARSIFSYRPCKQPLRPAGFLCPDRVN